MNKKIDVILGLALLCSANALISMDKPLHTKMDKVVLKNGTTNFDIAFKMANADTPAEVGVLPADKVLLLDFTPEKFSIKRSGYGDRYSSYTDYNLLRIVTNALYETPHKTRDQKSFGYIPMVTFESDYTNPLGWSVSVKWFQQPQ